MKVTFLSLFLAFSVLAKAQYTYINDRRFFDPTDLLGYDFKPGAMEIPDQTKKDLDPGEYSFGVTANNLYVKGEGIQGVYNINNIQPEDFGFKLLLMNARDARLQGHLKVILNKYSMVEALIFKRSPNEKEIIFYLLPITKVQRDQEKDYFTDRGELIFESVDSVWGKQIHPFLVIHQADVVQQRLQMKDSTQISFDEEIIIEEKEVKRKKSSKDKKDLAALGMDESDAVEGAGLQNDSLAVLPEVEDAATTGSGMPDSLQAGESQLPTSTDDAMEAPEVKVKITRNYYLTLKSLVKYTDGTSEIEEKRYQIRKIDEKEDTSAGLQEERYQWEVLNEEKERIMLYLNGDRTVSTLVIGDKKYLMRGF